MDTLQKDNVDQSKSIFDIIEEFGHEQITFCNNPATGLKAIIGIHDTTLGPALGGTRMWNYSSDQEAITDALRLSRGMTFKNALAGLNLGGGKAVIIGDPRLKKNEGLLRAYGKYVNNLGGKYITAEDVSMTTTDMEVIASQTKHVVGLPKSRGGSGDPSPYTAYSTYMGMKAAVKVAFGTDSLEGKKVAVQGTGHVGEYLIQYLEKEGCKIFVSEYYEPILKKVASKYNVEVVGLDDIYDLDIDIYAPCALGGTVNDDTLNRLRCQVIAGCANNQLKEEKKHGEACIKKGILYAPDFLINSGGVTNCYSEVIRADQEWTKKHIETFYGTTMEILKDSLKDNRNPQEIAIEKAMSRISLVKKSL